MGKKAPEDKPKGGLWAFMKRPAGPEPAPVEEQPEADPSSEVAIVEELSHSPSASTSKLAPPGTPPKQRGGRTSKPASKAGSEVIEIESSPEAAPKAAKQKEQKEKKKVKKRKLDQDQNGGPFNGKPQTLAELAKAREKVQEQRRILDTPVYPRWPNKDEHGSYSALATEADASTSTLPLERKKRQDVVEVDKDVDDEELDEDFKRIRKELFASLTAPPAPPKPPPQNVALDIDFDDHDLLDRLADSLADKTRTSTTALNTVEFAPQTADEVLGHTNRASARLLRQWLSDLAVSDDIFSTDASTKKRKGPVIQRERVQVKKKKRKNAWDDDDMDEFIVDEDEDLYPLDSDDEALSQSIVKPKSEASPFKELTNLILLSGPSGSGKTATVQAVAKEMGWEIFEVFPGIGKRGAKDLERYVGDVGKNHFLSNASFVSPKKGAASKLQAVAEDEPESQLSVVSDLATKPLAARIEGKESKVLQSLILIEEVDIRFEEDKEYWLGIRKLVAQCLRPVVMTCNDPDLVPAYDLALQPIPVAEGEPLAFLPFTPVEEEQALPFLNMVAAKMGRTMATQTAKRLYSGGGGDASTVPLFGEKEEVIQGDLRWALMQLQGHVPAALKPSMANGVSMDWERAESKAENVSFSDAYVYCLPTRTRLQLDSREGQGNPDPDEEIGMTYLRERSKDETVAPGLSADLAIASDLVERAGGFDSGLLHDFSDQALIHVALGETLQDCELIDLPTTRALIAADYTPYIRHITALDDQRQELLTGTLDAAARVDFGAPRRSTRFAGDGPTFQASLKMLAEDVLKVRASAFPAA